MEEQVQALHEMIKTIFPDAVHVKIIVNSDGIEVYPRYDANKSYSMKTISGEWLKRREIK